MRVSNFPRDFQPDADLPDYARGGKNFDFASSQMERGHMARDDDLEGFGQNATREGCLMSNIVPQRKGRNHVIWGDLEEEHQHVVAGPLGIETVWIVSGPIFFNDPPTKTVGNGTGVPDATYKVIAWLDVMVRDSRADETGGWVFGTYCYNGALNRRDPWTNLVPVGIQWGNDPDVLELGDNFTNPEATWTFYSDVLKETIINLDTEELPPQHVGWGGRLNGPADYYRSSCMSCHSTAQYPVLEPQHPDFEEHRRIAEGTPEWNAWFRNLPAGESFSPIVPGDTKRAISTDNSLQLAIGIDNFYQWKSRLMEGHFELVMPGADSSERAETYRPSSEVQE